MAQPDGQRKTEAAVMERSDGRKQKRGEGGDFIGVGGRGSRRGQELAHGARQRDLSAVQQGCGGD
jgi:hypothetical protein